MLAPRAQLASLYRRLHQAGIAHGDVSLRHVCRRFGDPALRVIDFDRGSIATDLSSSSDVVEMERRELLDIHLF